MEHFALSCQLSSLVFVEDFSTHYTLSKFSVSHIHYSSCTDRAVSSFKHVQRKVNRVLEKAERDGKTYKRIVVLASLRVGAV